MQTDNRIADNIASSCRLTLRDYINAVIDMARDSIGKIFESLLYSLLYSLPFIYIDFSKTWCGIDKYTEAFGIITYYHVGFITITYINIDDSDEK